MKKTKIFCSHAKADLKELVSVKTSWLSELHEVVCTKLGVENTRTPYEILRDQNGMLLGGDEIDEEIEAGIDACNLALLFISEAYILSENCAKEVELLLERGKTVIPIEMEKEWYNYESSIRTSY